MSEVREFLGAVIQHSIFLLGGGLIVVVVGLIERYKLESAFLAGKASPAGKPLGSSKTAKVAASRKRFTLWLAAGTALGSAVLAWLLSATSPLQLLELKTYDLRVVLRGKQTPPSNVLLVTID